ncbi:MAG TPA: pyridoxal phosphate-dependent aminotransferase [Holophagaceae bacterium]|nr:pyridoxal phosphate-dependent aminotransferase [Holophagaceae bacterium]
MRLSERAVHFPDSPIRKLGPLADRARAMGRKVIPLNIGQPDIATPPAFLDALHGYRDAVVAYGRSEGEPELREALAGYYRQLDLPLDADDIVITVGGSEALLFALQIAADPGDDALVIEPFYTNYAAFARMSGIELRGLAADPASGFRLPEDAQLLAAIGPRTRAILLCSPNNPTGTTLSAEELGRLARIAVKHDLFLIADEVYREFVYDGAHVSALSVPGIEDRVILVDSLSKRYSLCGARLGCIATRNRDARAAAGRMAMGRLCPPVPEQRAAAAMIAGLPKDFFAPIRDEYRHRRDALLEGLSAIPGLHCEKPAGAFYLMASLPVGDAEAFARWALTDFERDGETFMVAPGPGFYATPGLGADQVRLAYVIEESRLRRAAELMAEAVAQFQTARV